MAPSVKPAARLSERPFFPAVEIRIPDSSAGDERSREAPIPRVPPGVVRLRGGGEQSRLLVDRGPAFGVPGRWLAAASPPSPASSSVRRPSWTSDQARRPAELKHINKRRKSN